VGILFHDESVDVSAGVPFVTIRDNEFRLPVLTEYGTPFLACGKARTAAPAQTRLLDFADEFVWPLLEGLA
jgi:hypothetical protein